MPDLAQYPATAITEKVAGPGGTRTRDPGIRSPALYRMS